MIATRTTADAPGTWARTTAARAWAFAGLTVAVAVVAATYLLVPVREGVPAPDVTPLQVALDAAFLVITPILGALIVTRRPDIVIGWLFIHVAFWLGLGFLADGVARHAEPTQLVGVLTSIGSDLGTLAYGTLIVLIQLFPTGSLPSRRWRWLPALTSVAIALQVLTGLFSEPFDPPIPGLPVPLARPDWSAAVGAIAAVAQVMVVISLVGSLVLLARRFRRSTGIERQQLKWFAWAGVVVVGLLAVALVAEPLGPLAGALWQLAVCSLLLLPLAATAAILRYQLWAIDRIVSRTIGWALVSGALVAVFAVAVVGLQAALSGVTRDQTIAVAASTLLAFALFQPLRRRVQRAVDRRFDRSRYDAQLTADAFAERLRGEVAIDVVATDLETTIDTAVRPAAQGLWLRASSGDRSVLARP
jgi:hypothetical protein